MLILANVDAVIVGVILCGALLFKGKGVSCLGPCEGRDWDSLRGAREKGHETEGHRGESERDGRKDTYAGSEERSGKSHLAVFGGRWAPIDGLKFSSTLLGRNERRPLGHVSAARTF